MSALRCDGCKHWSPDASWESTKAGFRRCEAVRPRWHILDGVDRWSDEERGAQALRAARAYVEDGSEYYAALLTGPDFFCALHSPYDPQTTEGTEC